jgi:hypothetical protein
MMLIIFFVSFRLILDRTRKVRMFEIIKLTPILSRFRFITSGNTKVKTDEIMILIMFLFHFRLISDQTRKVRILETIKLNVILFRFRFISK